MRARLERFMYGRYGQDDLGRVMSIAALVLCVVSIFTRWTFFYSLAMVLLVFGVFRMFSRNTAQRARENYGYLGLLGKVKRFFIRIKNRITQSRTHRFYKCPSCKQQLRVPKGKGRISVNCPKCHTSFERKT